MDCVLTRPGQCNAPHYRKASGVIIFARLPNWTARLVDFRVDKTKVSCLRERHGVSLPRRCATARAGWLAGTSTG